MLVPKRLDTSITGRMADVRGAFDAGAFMSAISLLLTLPDICGRRLYPGTGSRERYVKWFDEYVAPAYLGPRLDDSDSWKIQESGTGYVSYPTSYFTGADCYQLRCVYLHEGTNAPHQSTPFHAIQFRVFDCIPGNWSGGCNHVGQMKSDDGEEFLQVDLDLGCFIDRMEDGIGRFLAGHPENEDHGSDSCLYQPILDFRSGVAKNM